MKEKVKRVVLTSPRSSIHRILADLIGMVAEPPPTTLLPITIPQVIGAIDRISEWDMYLLINLKFTASVLVDNETVLAYDKTLGFKLQRLRCTPHLTSFPAAGTRKSGICSPDKVYVFVTVWHSPKLAHVGEKGGCIQLGFKPEQELELNS